MGNELTAGRYTEQRGGCSTGVHLLWKSMQVQSRAFGRYKADGCSTVVAVKTGSTVAINDHATLASLNEPRRMEEGT